MVLFGGLLLLFLRPALFHGFVCLRANGGVFLAAGSASFLPLVDVANQAHDGYFLVDLPLWPLRARFRLLLSRTSFPFFVWERSGPPFPAMPRFRRSVQRFSDAFLTDGFLFSFRWYAAFLAAALGLRA